MLKVKSSDISRTYERVALSRRIADLLKDDISLVPGSLPHKLPCFDFTPSSDYKIRSPLLASQMVSTFPERLLWSDLTVEERSHIL
jgi:hypothetical protein